MTNGRMNRGEKIAFCGLLVAIIRCIATLFTVPDIREKLGLDLAAMPSEQSFSPVASRHIGVQVSGANGFITISAKQGSDMQNSYIVSGANETTAISLIPGTKISLHVAGANNSIIVSKQLV